MTNQFIDVREYGARADGTTDDTAAFIKASEAACRNGGILVATGAFKLTDNVDIFTDCDFSQARLIVDGGKLTILQNELEKNERTFESACNEFDPCHLSYLQTSFKDVFSDNDILKTFSNSFVRIESDDPHIYRRDGDARPVEQTKSTVTLLNDYGRLSYSLTHDFTSASAQTKIILRKLPAKRLRFIAPEFSIERVRKEWAVLEIRRDLTEVIGFTCTNKIATTDDNLYTGLIYCESCYDLMFQGASLPGYGVPSINEPAIPRKVLYDCLLRKVVKIRFDSINSNTGWKTIDGNHIRDMVITDSALDSVHGHFNVADVTVARSTISGWAGLAFGTGSADSTITIRDCKFITRAPIAMRRDFGELRGSVVVENCIFDLREDSDSDETTILTLFDDAIRRIDREQPSTYSLPSRIILRNISITSSKTCNLIRFNNQDDVYGPGRRLGGPGVIHIDGVDFTGVGGDLRFRYRFVPYDADTADPVVVRIDNVRSKRANHRFDVRFGTTSAGQEKVHYRASISNVDHLNGFFMGSARSEVHIDKSSASALDTYDAGGSTLRCLALDGVTFKFDKNADQRDHFVISARIQRSSVVNCVFDGTAYKQQHGTPLPLDARVHHASGNLAIDCGNTGPDGYGRDGRQAAVPGVGVAHNYELGSNGLLRPSWPI